MANRPTAYVQWFEERDSPSPAGQRPGERSAEEQRPWHRAAWLLCDVPDGNNRQQRRVLAYLGRRPVVTGTLREEIAALYPDVTVDWSAIQASIDAHSGVAAIAALTDDELALRLRELARDRGLSLIDLSLVLGYRDRQILPELMQLLNDEGRIARYERTSGSVYTYMEERHPEYAFLLYKARLFFEAREGALQAAISDEPAGYSDEAWRARRAFWRERLEAYRAERRAPS
jgi:hypothetical protein